jgi:hypothetical protein
MTIHRNVTRAPVWDGVMTGSAPATAVIGEGSPT